MIVVSSFAALLQEVSLVMTAPTFDTFLMLTTGWIFARRRTVTGMMLAADVVGVKHHSAFHRFFASAAWSLDEFGLAVFGLMQRWLSAVVMVGIDDTLARKRGLKVYGVGMHHDPLLSTRKVAVTHWGHSWVVLGVIIRLPLCKKRYFCLPILFRLYISRQTIAKKGGRYRTRPELAVEMLQLLCKRHENRRFHAVADSAYGGKSVLLNLPGNCDLTSRLDLDARLHDAPSVRKSRKGGRPRKRGQRLPSPRQMLEGRGRRITLNIYGRKDRSRVVDCIARLYAAPDREVRAVGVEPLTGGRTTQAFYSTRHDASVEQVLTWYAMRWSIEEAFQQSKGQLGFEEPQGWSRRAVERTAPMAMLLHSLIVLWFAAEGHRHYRVLWRPWYCGKCRASFADMLATLRQECVREQVSALQPKGRGSRNLVKSLIHAVKQAA
jgi:DDE superfamily endonuclease